MGRYILALSVGNSFFIKKIICEERCIPSLLALNAPNCKYKGKFLGKDFFLNRKFYKTKKNAKQCS